MTNAEPCPCGSKKTAEHCCLPVIKNHSAESAEALMRSRYTAYVLCDEAYLLASWAPETRPTQIGLVPNQRWLGLKIKRTEAGGQNDETGVVEFVARFKIDGRAHRLHETSEFRQENGRWFYVSGTIA